MGEEYPSPHPKLDMEWARKEVIPLFVSICAKDARHNRLTSAQLEKCVITASHTIDTLLIYEDFDSTVERVRLMLVNPSLMTKAEEDDFGWIRNHTQMCIAIFVRHAMRHGTFKIHSLSTEPNPDHPRRRVHDQTYIYGGKFAGKDPRKHTGYQRPPLVPNLTSGGHNDTFRGRSRPFVRRGNLGRGGYNGGSKGRGQWPEPTQESIPLALSVDDNVSDGTSSSGGPVQPVFSASAREWRGNPTYGAGDMAGGGRGKSSFNNYSFQHLSPHGRLAGKYSPSHDQPYMHHPPLNSYGVGVHHHGQAYPQAKDRFLRFGMDGTKDNVSRGTSTDKHLPGDAIEFKPGAWFHGA